MSSKKKAGKAGGKEKKDSKGAKASGASKASVSISSLTASSPPSGGTNPTSDFEAGLLFSKYDSTGTGVLTAEDFRRMWKETKDTPAPPSLSVPLSTSTVAPMSSSNKPMDSVSVAFEAGQVFTAFDTDKDGKLSKSDFESLIKLHPDLLKINERPRSSKAPDLSYPLEIITGRMLSHYDETACIPISGEEVEQHRNMGHAIVPLADAYKARYERLRALLASKLLPRREHLVQLRRQLQTTSSEIEAVRKGIEKETLSDTEKIIERLRAVESLRQSAISHQTLHLEEELDIIERIIRRVEQAHDDATKMSVGSGGVITTSAVPGALSVEKLRSPKAAAMVELIQQFHDLCNQIDKVSNKQLHIQVDFPTDDFPREISERLEVIARCDNYQHALQVKDHMLWTALQSQNHLEEALNEEKRLSHAYADEVTQWAEIVSTMSQELDQVKKDNESLVKKNQELLEIIRRNNLMYAGHRLR